MASRQSDAVAELYRRWVAAPTQHGDWSPEDQRRMVEDTWIGLTGEPGGVDYLEADAGGGPAMWAIPKGAPEGRVLFAVHGGGFISGSVYTHRKLYARSRNSTGYLRGATIEAPSFDPVDQVQKPPRKRGKLTGGAAGTGG